MYRLVALVTDSAAEPMVFVSLVHLLGIFANIGCYINIAGVFTWPSDVHVGIAVHIRCGPPILEKQVS